jgi:aminopeptidase N
VALHVYVDGGAERVSELGLAMKSLKRAMAWDEEEFGREYDLSVFNVVAVADFNMGP